MRLVLDTNVIVSAFINPSGKPSQILKMVINRKAELCFNTAILGEYENVMLRPKFSNIINSDNVRRFINLLRSIGFSYNPSPGRIKHQQLYMPDESDRIFYDTAMESKSLLITGNIKHYPKEPFIMLPSDFIKKTYET